MAEPERTTSFAKSVEGLHKEESALDRARSLRDQFTHAQEQNNEKQKPRETARQQGETEKSGSQMVKQDAPALQPTPNGNMRQAADRFAAYRKLAKEHTNVGTNTEQKAKILRDNIAAASKTPDRSAAPNPEKQDPKMEAAKAEAAQKAWKTFQERQQQIRDHGNDRER